MSVDTLLLSVVISLENALGGENSTITSGENTVRPGAFSKIVGRSFFKQKEHRGANTPRERDVVFHKCSPIHHPQIIGNLQCWASVVVCEQGFGPKQDKDKEMEDSYDDKKQIVYSRDGRLGMLATETPAIFRVPESRQGQSLAERLSFALAFGPSSGGVSWYFTPCFWRCARTFFVDNRPVKEKIAEKTPCEINDNNNITTDG